MVLEKSLTLYDRDENGELIPQEVKVEIDEDDEAQLAFKGETIFITPLARGEIRKLFSTASKDESSDLDGDIISKHCEQPSYTKEEVPFIKPELASIIVNTIFRESGVGTNTKASKKKRLQEAEDDFAKN